MNNLNKILKVLEFSCWGIASRDHPRSSRGQALQWFASHIGIQAYIQGLVEKAEITGVEIKFAEENIHI